MSGNVDEIAKLVALSEESKKCRDESAGFMKDLGGAVVNGEP